jgi:hypothetical protein
MAPAPAKVSSRALWLLFAAFAGGALLCIAGVFVPVSLVTASAERARLEECRRTMVRVRDEIARSEEPPEEERGSALLESLAGWRAGCRAGAYRGPNVAWRDLTPDGIAACDEAEAHRDGAHVLFRDGRIEFAPKGSELYSRAMRQTQE